MELGFRLGLTPYGVDGSQAALVAIAAHAIHLVLMAAFAGAGMLIAEQRAVVVETPLSEPAPDPIADRS